MTIELLPLCTLRGHQWPNKIQAVGKGTLDGTTLTYEVYELR